MKITLTLNVEATDQSLVSATNIVTAINDGIQANISEDVAIEITDASAEIIQNYTILPQEEEVTPEYQG